ncbi:MAG: nif-specific transcriptional activator NifA [Rhodomicrobium sp.]
MTNSAPARTGAMPSSGRYSETALSGIYEISKIVTSPSSLKVMLNNVVSVMSSFLDMRLASLVLIDQDGDPEIKVSASTEPALAAGDSAEIPMAVIDQIVATATPLAVQNCALHPLFAGWKRLGSIAPGFIQTFIGVPIRVDSEVAGTLAIERVWKGTMDVRIDHDVRFLTMVANLVGQALKLHRVVAEDRERLIFEQHRLAKELSTLKAAKSPPPKLSGILGKSRAIRAVTERIEQVAKSNAPVLIRGETGTGKELFARAIHELSARKGKPFIKVNCAALPESVIESELFGHEKGAFTGAIATRKGRFELAHGGTIFLDEIGEISHAFQAKLLRVLQEGEFERVGGQHTLKVNFRLVCATNRNLEEFVTTEKFRADLYYRINVVPLMLPPLRDRVGDIPELAQHFLHAFGTENGHDLRFGPDALDVLCRCYFPGNVRELENCVRRTAAMTPSEDIHAKDFACQQGHCLSAMLWKGPAGHHPHPHTHTHTPKLARPEPAAPPAPPAPPPHQPPPERIERSAGVNGRPGEFYAQGEANGALSQVGRDTLIQAMEKTGWVQAKAARILGVTPRQIGYALKKHGVEMKRF